MFRLRSHSTDSGWCVERTGIARATRLSALALLLGCSDRALAPTPPANHTGRVRIQATTTGRDLDGDGYVVRIDGVEWPTRVAPNGDVTIPSLSVGSHRIDLDGIDLNCRAETTEIAFTISSPGETVPVDVRISCVAFGSLQVTVSTTGTDFDLNGYRILVSGGPGLNEVRGGLSIPTSGNFLFPRMAPGRHRVRLQDIAVNCGGSDLNPREVDIASEGNVVVTFQLACETPGLIAFSAADFTGRFDIWVVRSNGTGATRLTDHAANDDDPAWSPDGTRIAFTSTRNGIDGVFVMNENGSGLTGLTSPAAPNYRPAWSPDGAHIAFISERDGNPEIYVMNADGSNQVRLTTHAAADVDPAWSPDGGRIAFSSRRDGNAEIYVMNADGSGLTRVTSIEPADTRPAWSPDGRTIAFTSVRCIVGGRYPNSCYPAVMLTTPSGGVPVEVGIGDDPAWSPDGTRVAATEFLCDFYYSYGADPCTVAGIGIVSPIVIGQSGYTETFESNVTKGVHQNPAWRP